MTLNQKGVATLVSVMLYIFITIVVVGVVTTAAVDLFTKNREVGNYKVMLDSFQKLDQAIQDSATQKENIELTIYNPEEFEIDCNQNRIIGNIKYSEDYRSDDTIVNGITTYKDKGSVYFEKNLNDYNRLQLDCSNKILVKGKNKLVLKYFRYDETSNKILIDIFQNTNAEDVDSWYSSKWQYRKQISINHEYIDEDLTNFPMLVDVSDQQLQNARADGKDIIFTDASGNKLEREIESFIKAIPTSSSSSESQANEIIPYYIEDMNTSKLIWIKTDIPANSTRKIKVTKKSGYTPNGNNVFEFFDDFDNSYIDPNKWGYISGFPQPAVYDQNLYIAGTTSYLVSKNKIPSYNKIFKMRMYPVTNTSSADCAMHVMGDCSTCGYTYNKGIAFGTNLNSTMYEIFASNYCGAAAIYTSTTVSAIERYLNFDATITDENTYKVRQVVTDDNGSLINDSGFSIINTQRCFNETGYLNLRTQPAANGMYVDYLFVRKYTEKEPFVDVYDEGTYFEIIITNDSSDNLTDYQVAIPNDIIGITTKTESLKVEELPLETIGFIEEKTIPYYIEDDGTNKFTFVKQTIPGNTIKTLKITKENGYTPNGNRVFDFFDDFTSAQLDLGKWSDGTTPIYVSSGETLRINVGAVTLSNPLSFNLQDNYIIRTRSKNINTTASNGGTTPLLLSARFVASSNGNSDASISIVKTTSTSTAMVLNSATGASASYNITNGVTLFTSTLDQYNVFDVITKINSFDINKDDTNVYSSLNYTFTKNMNYISLGAMTGAATDIGDTEYDYVYVRKYVENEPTVVVTDNGSDYTVTIENTTEDDLTNYQVKISNDVLSVLSKTESLKIEYTIPPEPTPTPSDTAETRLFAWVKVPMLYSITDTNIYMYFGNSGYIEENSTAVWDENYLYVEHFDDVIIQNNQSSLSDSTGRVIATPYNFDNTSKSKFKTEGLFGDSVLCDGINDYIIAPASLSEINDNNLLTISLWVKTNIISKLAMPFGSFTPAAARIYLGTHTSTWARGVGSVVWAASSFPVTTNWTKLVLIINKNSPNSKFFANTDLVYDTNAFVWTNTTDFPYICGTGAYCWDGYIDEIRIEKNIRSDAWRKAEYYNQQDPNNFYDVYSNQ